MSANKRAILEPHAINDVVDANGMRVAGMARGPGIHDVELLFVGREANTVGLIHVAGDDGGFARFGVKAVNDGGQLKRGFVAFVIGHDAVAGIGEPDGTVGMHGEIVGGVGLFALKSVYQHGDGAVVFGARQAARVVLAGEQPALAVAAGCRCCSSRGYGRR